LKKYFLKKVSQKPLVKCKNIFIAKICPELVTKFVPGFLFAALFSKKCVFGATFSKKVEN